MPSYNIITGTPKKPDDNKDMKVAYYGNTGTIGGSIPNGPLNSLISNNKNNNSTSSTQDHMSNQYNISSNAVDQDRLKFISPAKKNDYPGSMKSIINNVTYGRASMSTNKQIIGNNDSQNSNNVSTSNSNNVNSNTQRLYGIPLQSNGSTTNNANIPNDKINNSKTNESPYYVPILTNKQDSSLISQAKLIQNNYPSSNVGNSISNEGYKSTINTDSSNINSSLINRSAFISNSQNKK